VQLVGTVGTVGTVEAVEAVELVECSMDMYSTSIDDISASISLRLLGLYGFEARTLQRRMEVMRRERIGLGENSE
jgi:hypothetical protein